jgi:hypothetical protein
MFLNRIRENEDFLEDLPNIIYVMFCSNWYSSVKRKFLQYIGQSETKMTCGDHAILLDKNYRELPVATMLYC